MNLSLSDIRLISQLSQKSFFGATLYLALSLYNNLARFSNFLSSYLEPTTIHNTAIIHPSSIVSNWGVSILQEVTIKEKAVVKANSIVGRGSNIGEESVIGETGFQVYRFRSKRLLIIHTGKVEVGDYVLIGSGSCVDRALFRKKTVIGSDTIIGQNVKIGHNVLLGSTCHLGNNVAVGGNSTIGDRVIISENVSIANRITIASDSFIPPGTIVTRDIPGRNQE